MMEGLVLGVEAIVLAARPRQADAHRHVEQQRQPRRDAAARPRLGARHLLEIEPSAVALIGDGRGAEAVDQHDLPGGQRRDDALADVLGAVGEVEEQLGERRRSRLGARVQQGLTQAGAECRRARLEGHLDAAPCAAQRLGGARDLRRLAAALRPLERDQTPRRHDQVCLHSVSPL